MIAVVPLLLHSWRALLGEPVADDYDFLYDALLEPRRSFFDGGGVMIYWRPLSRQVYYSLFGTLMLSHPRILASIHASLLVLTVWLLYRTLRAVRWDGPSAALAATFPLFTEGTRTLLLWPAAFQDLGALLFSALALHEAAHRRWGTTSIALLAGLLCKEIALVTAVLVPWMPNGTNEPAKKRIRPAMAIAGVVALWGVVYVLVRQSTHVLFQRHLEEGRAPLPQRLLWAFGHAGADALSVDQRHPMLVLAVAAIALALALAGILLARRAAGAGWPRAAWILWGLTWFALATATLSETYPQWGGFRSAVGLVGLGIGTAAILSGLGMAGVTLLTLLRLTTFFLSPAPPVTVTQAPPAGGSVLDFGSLARLQRYAAEVRELVTARFPRLPPRSIVAQHHRPLMAEVAFADEHALRMWYRDTTLRWVDWNQILQAQTLRPATVVEYQPHLARQVALIDGEAMAQYLDAMRNIGENRWEAALMAFGRADSLQTDRGTAVFLGTVAGKRSLCWLALDRGVAAHQDALRSLELWRYGRDARYTLAVLLAMDADYRGALAQVDTLLAGYPFDEGALMLRNDLRAEVNRRGSASRP